jgi:hypothetical protein
MAGHLPIPTDRVHNARIKEALRLDIANQKHFERIHTDKGFYQLLTSEYDMSCEHGKVDDLIFAFTPNSLDKVFEYHLDRDKKINEIYLVM